MAGSGSGMAMARKSLRFPFYLFAGQARAPPAAIFKSDVRVAASNRVDNVTIS
jgi:hypothetical protein